MSMLGIIGQLDLLALISRIESLLMLLLLPMLMGCPVGLAAAAAVAAAAAAAAGATVAESTPHHQHAIPSNLQAVTVPRHTRAHTCNSSRAVTWGTPHSVTGFFCFAGCPFLDALVLASLAWSAKSC
eukprot:1145691-Pelagomonas_calceolata.AAC.2